MRVLVVHGSGRGGTAGLAHLLAEALGDRGLSAQVEPAAVAAGPEGFDAVLLGASLRYNRWHAAAAGYAREHRNTLAERPVWLFSSGPLDDSARLGALAAVPQVQKIARAVGARGHMTFGGRFERSGATPLDLVWAHGRHGDHRDPAQVQEWVAHIARVLTPPTRIAAPVALMETAPELPPQRVAGEAPTRRRQAAAR